MAITINQPEKKKDWADKLSTGLDVVGKVASAGSSIKDIAGKVGGASKVFDEVKERAPVEDMLGAMNRRQKNTYNSGTW